MKNYLKKTSLLSLFAVVLFGSCKKDNNNSGSSNSRMVKYEITGNFTGKLIVVYLDNVSGNTLVTDVTLPWSKEITYNSNVIGIGISGQSSSFGRAGETAALKIYSGGAIVKSQPATAGDIGQIMLPTFTYSF
jgi:hypothetical protein